MSSISGSLESR